MKPSLRTPSARTALALVLVLLVGVARAEVLVDEVSPGGMGDAVGLTPGRVFDAWQRLDDEGRVVDEGPLETPFDFVAVQFEIAPRGAVRLSGPDGSVDLAWEEWGIAVSPPLPAGVDAAGDRAVWTRAAADAAEDPLERAWWLTEAAVANGSGEEGDALFGEAIEVATTDVARAQIFLRRADAARDRSAFDTARAHYEAALLLDGERAPDGLAVARDHARLGGLAGRRREIDRAREHYERAIEILRTEARPGPLLAEVLGAQGFVLNVAGDMDGSAQLLEEARALVDASGLEGRVAVIVLNNQGSLRARRGDFEGAIRVFAQIVRICETTGRRGRILGNAWFNQGVCLRRLGRLADAERALRRSLELRREIAEESLDVAQSYETLANVQGDRGDDERSLDGLRRAVEIYERLSPDGYPLAIGLVNLGATCARLGRFDETEQHYRRAVEILGRTAPDSYAHTQALRNLSQLYRDQERWEEAEVITRRVLESIRKLAPDSLDEARILEMLAQDAYRRDDHERAIELFDRTWELRARSAPGSRATANAALWAGRVRDDTGDLADATRCYCEAVDILDVQRTHYGGTESQNVDFAREYEGFAAFCLESLVSLDDVERAFTVLERTRARHLLGLFADREGLLDGEVPDPIRERRRAHRQAVDGTLAELARVGASAPERAEELREQLAALEQERQEIASILRLEAPRLDTLEAFDTLDAAEIVAALDPSTVYVSYWLGPEAATAFVVPAGTGAREVEAFVSPIGTEALEEKVTRLREAIARGAARATVDDVASELHSALVAPWAKHLQAADRLLISPAGPLRVLPFAALKDDGGHYLIEHLPLHTVDSATLYARLIDRRDDFDAAHARVVAFGDPVYDAGSPATAPVSTPIVALRQRGYTLEPLPGTRREVAVLDSLFAPSVEVHVGPSATEERVKALGSDVDILHFACHAVADREIPSASALVLTQPGPDQAADENGLLQAWEILEDVRLDAELVTLSACQTAIGKELGPEGMAGLTRAFQYAGARSIVASLWDVPDEPTASLMRDFYANLARGLPKDESLRRAQLASLRGASNGADGAARALGGLTPSDRDVPRAPGFAWAAMQLVGDWR